MRVWPRIRMFMALAIGFQLASAAADVRILNSPRDLPEKFSSLARKGDTIIAGAKFLAVIGGSARPVLNNSNYPISNALGALIGFGPAGLHDPAEVNIGAPIIRINGRPVQIAHASFAQKKGQPGGRFIFEASGLYQDREGRRAAIKTVYDFLPEAALVDITSSIANTGQVPISDLAYSITSDAYNGYAFNPYHEKRFPRLNFRVNQKKGHALGWISLNPPSKSGEVLPDNLAPGESYKVHYLFLTEATQETLLAEVYRRLRVPSAKATLSFKDFHGRLLEVVVRESLSGATVFRTFRDSAGSLEVPLPEGVHRVRANLFPAVVEDLIEVRSGGENRLTVRAPDAATLTLSIRNRRKEFVPGKITFIGLESTRTPYFAPSNPVESGRSYEGFKNSCYPPEKGSKVEVPAGTYLVYAARGPEYSVDQRIVEVLGGENQELGFTIDKVVDTPGLVSLDPHMHTQLSDGYVTVEERLRSLVAEGIDAAIATDHNTVTDYAPALEALGLAPFLAVLPGSEVTINGMIHYNTYPMRIIPGEAARGAISPLAENPDALFQASRLKNPDALIQINHPRAGDLGYFNNFLLDLDSAATALAGLDLTFDAIEIMNGAYPYSSNQAAVQDWLHLLNRGYIFPAVGSSDVHGIDRVEPGYSRTYVSHREPKAGRLDWKTLLQAVKKGRSFVSNGPLVEVRINGKHMPGDTFTARSGKVKASVRVWSAPWVEVSEVCLIVNGERKLERPVQAKPGSLTKFDENLSLTVDRDSYVILEVVGRKTLYPVHQEQQRTGRLENAAVPYALTNPVFIDVDGNGVFDPPVKEKVELLTEIKDKRKTISRY